MSPLDDLTPDQRAVLQLLLRQGKTYGELAALLRIDPDAVRRRAIDAVAALGPDLDPEGRDVLTDWLLGQLDDERSAHARDLLTGSTAALEWAAAVSVRLAEAGLEPRGALPAVEPDPEPEAEAAAEGADAGAQAPAGAPPAGAAPGDDAPPPAADPPAAEGDEDPAAAEGGEDGEDGAPEASPPAGDAPRPREAEAPAPLPGFAPAAAGDARPSRLGGVLLIGGLVVVIVVVAVILLGGGDSDGGTVTSTQGGATATQAATEATTPTTGELTVEAQVNMRAPGGGDALGVAQIITDGATRGVSVTAEGLEPNGEQDRYALWLTGGPGGKAYLLGFSTTAVTRNGRFGGSAELPEDADDYRRIELSRETRDDPRTPTEVVLRGSFRTR